MNGGFFKSHYDSCRKYKENGKVSLACTMCSQTYCARKSINTHLYEVHGVKNQKYKRNKEWKKDKVLNCGYIANNQICAVRPIEIHDLIMHQINQKHDVCYYCKTSLIQNS